MYRTIGVILLILAFVAAVALVSGSPSQKDGATITTAVTSPPYAASLMPGVEGNTHSGANEATASPPARLAMVEVRGQMDGSFSRISNTEADRLAHDAVGIKAGAIDHPAPGIGALC